VAESDRERHERECGQEEERRQREREREHEREREPEVGEDAPAYAPLPGDPSVPYEDGERGD
jgi:hypothetical protein